MTNLIFAIDTNEPAGRTLMNLAHAGSTGGWRNVLHGSVGPCGVAH